jgi:hypothetical protein
MNDLRNAISAAWRAPESSHSQAELRAAVQGLVSVRRAEGASMDRIRDELTRITNGTLRAELRDSPVEEATDNLLHEIIALANELDPGTDATGAEPFARNRLSPLMMSVVLVVVIILFELCSRFGVRSPF